MKTEVTTIDNGAVRGTWLKTDDGTLAAVYESHEASFPYVCAYKKGEEGKLPYAMRWEAGTGELLLQIPGDMPDKVTIIRMKHIAELVRTALAVRYGGEFRSDDKVS